MRSPRPPLGAKAAPWLALAVLAGSGFADDTLLGDREALEAELKAQTGVTLEEPPPPPRAHLTVTTTTRTAPGSTGARPGAPAGGVVGATAAVGGVTSLTPLSGSDPSGGSRAGSRVREHRVVLSSPLGPKRTTKFVNPERPAQSGEHATARLLASLPASLVRRQQPEEFRAALAGLLAEAAGDAAPAPGVRVGALERAEAEEVLDQFFPSTARAGRQRLARTHGQLFVRRAAPQAPASGEARASLTMLGLTAEGTFEVVARVAASGAVPGDLPGAAHRAAFEGLTLQAWAEGLRAPEVAEPASR